MLLMKKVDASKEKKEGESVEDLKVAEKPTEELTEEAKETKEKTREVKDETKEEVKAEADESKGDATNAEMKTDGGKAGEDATKEEDKSGGKRRRRLRSVTPPTLLLRGPLPTQVHVMAPEPGGECRHVLCNWYC